MAEPKRYFTKYVRDGAKSGYKKASTCYVCGSAGPLDFHHFYSLAELVSDWLEKRNLSIETAEDALYWRNIFIEEHQAELYEHAVTLCKDHHQRLHAIYGRNPPQVTAKKQRHWVNVQREKNGLI